MLVYLYLQGKKNSSSHRPYVLNLKSCRLFWDLPNAKGHGTMIANFPLVSYQERFAEGDPSLINFRRL